MVHLATLCATSLRILAMQRRELAIAVIGIAAVRSNGLLQVIVR
jgi:hypothetical protein